MHKFFYGFLFFIILLGIVYVLTGGNTLGLQRFNLPSAVSPTKTQLANPASQNCIAKGGSLTIQKRGDGGEYGLCQFEDDMSCEEWAMFRGDCPVGGVKTTGFSTIAQKYCAWSGGKTFAITNATCILPNGIVCNDDSLYNGLCSQDTDPSESLFNTIQQNAPLTYTWQLPKKDTLDFGGKTYKGISRIATFTSDQGAIVNLGETDALTAQGWELDNNFAAGGPNGGAWGYTKNNQLLFFSWKNTSFTGLDTKCPCNMQINVFYTDSFKE